MYRFFLWSNHLLVYISQVIIVPPKLQEVRYTLQFLFLCASFFLLFLYHFNVRYFPKGIDIYFDNVGGAMLDAALMNMRVHGRVAICGMVSQHSISDPKGISNLYTLVMKRVRMQGFIQSDYLHLHPEFLKTIVSFYKQGKIVYIEDMNEGLENGPAAFVGLFSGKNVGKQIVRVAQE